MRITLRSSLDHIFSLQREESFILTGFYLNQMALQEITPYLTEDEPDVGAIGRYYRVPVFAFEHLQREHISAPHHISEHNGIAYSYVQMGVVD